MSAKTSQLQIRVSPQEKAALKRQARAAGRDLSGYVLSMVFPTGLNRFAQVIESLAGATDHRYALAELSDLLHGTAPLAFGPMVADADLSALRPYLQNYVAAMVEQAASAKSVAPPAWTSEIVPLDTPHFATPMKNLRTHLLRAAPVPFKRRNIFIDASVGARV